jgi:hypothetical protein
LFTNLSKFAGHSPQTVLPLIDKNYLIDFNTEKNATMFQHALIVEVRTLVA